MRRLRPDLVACGQILAVRVRGPSAGERLWRLSVSGLSGPMDGPGGLIHSFFFFFSYLIYEGRQKNNCLH